MRKKETVCMTARNQQRKYVMGFGIVAVFLLLSAVLMGHRNTPYENPPFEQNAKRIDAMEKDDKSYHVLDIAPGYRVGLCGMPKENGRQLTVCVTNEKENQVWIQLLVQDENEKMLVKTGVLKPGEGLSQITLSRKLEEGETLKFIVRGYEPETYYSAGEVSLETKCRKDA